MSQESIFKIHSRFKIQDSRWSLVDSFQKIVVRFFMWDLWLWLLIFEIDCRINRQIAFSLSRCLSVSFCLCGSALQCVDDQQGSRICDQNHNIWSNWNWNRVKSHGIENTHISYALTSLILFLCMFPFLLFLTSLLGIVGWFGLVCINGGEKKQ